MEQIELNKLWSLLHHIYGAHHLCSLQKAERGLPKGRLCDECEDMIKSHLAEFVVKPNEYKFIKIPPKI